ncbi:ABC transporter permease [Bosea sp. (in: a-proteobacteria)]|uniref:ABC transporter permease n=1 Tax=Bosea sp. (in: a-proteobacteria) TaxID=1871050 RepID=UPI002FC5FF89
MTERISLPLKLLAGAIFLFLLAPSLVVIPMSFSDSREIMFPPRGFSLMLYREYFAGPEWVAATIESTIVAIGATVLSLAAGIPVAYAIARSRLASVRIIRALVLMPMLVPTIVFSLGLYLYFARIGISGSTLALILGHAVHNLPFVTVVAIAGLRQVNPNIEIAAQVLGASTLRIFFSVVVPIIRPSIIAAGLFSFLISFDEVVIAWFLSSPRAMTLPIKMYSSIQWEVSPVLAAISTLLTVLSLVICVIGLALREKEA